MTTRISLLAFLLVGAAACGDDSSTTTEGAGGAGSGSTGSGDGGATSSSTSVGTGPGTGGGATTSGSSTSSGTASTSSSTGTGGGAACREPAPADRDRFVVVGHPFPNDVTDWEVLSLSEAGVLSQTGKTFTMGSAYDQRIEFTADGEIGFAVQDDGSLGVFRLAADGMPTVIDAHFGLDLFYADAVVLAPSGDHVVVADSNWPNNGGGLYRVDVDCATGELGVPTKLGESKNVWSLLSLGGDRWVAAGTGAFGVEDGTDLHDVRATDPWSRVGGADAFAYGGSLPSSLVASRDGTFLLVGDTSGFGDEENRVTMASVDAQGFSVLGEAVLLDPYDLAIAPEGDVAIAVSGFGDAIFVLDLDAGGSTPIDLRGELAYVGGAPQVPGKLAMVGRGSLDGLVLVGDVEGIRTVRFQGAGVVTDLGLTSLGEGIAAMPAGIGIQP